MNINVITPRDCDDQDCRINENIFIAVIFIQNFNDFSQVFLEENYLLKLYKYLYFVNIKVKIYKLN